MIYKVLVLGFEFNVWIHGDDLVVMLKLFASVLFFEGSDNISDIFVFSKKSLVLASALNRGS